jgi:hypothetical protein
MSDLSEPQSPYDVRAQHAVRDAMHFAIARYGIWIEAEYDVASLARVVGALSVLSLIPAALTFDRRADTLTFAMIVECDAQTCDLLVGRLSALVVVIAVTCERLSGEINLEDDHAPTKRESA